MAWSFTNDLLILSKYGFLQTKEILVNKSELIETLAKETELSKAAAGGCPFHHR